MTSVVQYRLSLKKNIGRKAGKSVVASAAYIARERLKDRESGKTHDYRKGHSEVLFSKIFTPEIVPEWAHDRNELWNKVQESEHRKDSQFARSLEISLPHEFTQEHMVELIENFVQDNFISKGMIADVALHKPDDHAANNRNYHAHILLTLREVNADGFGYKVREWNHKNMLRSWREDLALKLSNMFEFPAYSNGDKLSSRWLFSHLTLVKQRKKAIDRRDFGYVNACEHEPTKHKGVQIYHMEKRGIESYVEKRRNEKRNASKTIEQNKILEPDPTFFIENDGKDTREWLRGIHDWSEQIRQQRDHEQTQRAIDDELKQRFGSIHPDLKNNKEITPELRAQLLKALEYSKQAEKDLELDYQREQDREGDR